KYREQVRFRRGSAVPVPRPAQECARELATEDEPSPIASREDTDRRTRQALGAARGVTRGAVLPADRAVVRADAGLADALVGDRERRTRGCRVRSGGNGERGRAGDGAD